MLLHSTRNTYDVSIYTFRNLWSIVTRIGNARPRGFVFGSAAPRSCNINSTSYHSHGDYLPLYDAATGRLLPRTLLKTEQRPETEQSSSSALQINRNSRLLGHSRRCTLATSVVKGRATSSCFNIDGRHADLGLFPRVVRSSVCRKLSRVSSVSLVIRSI